jgi:Domain of unknown function (DUF4157)
LSAGRPVSDAARRRRTMHEFEREGPHAAPRREPETNAGRTREGAAPATGTRTGAMDAASISQLQRTVGNAAVVQLLASDEEASPVHDVVGGGGGQPLDPGTRSEMESAFADSFGDVRVHTDSAASASAESVGANAYTVGSDIVFRSGHGPGSPTFQRDVAHELTHVQQQKAGPVDGSDAGGGIRVSDPSDRFEQAASTRADEIVGGLSAQRSVETTSDTLQREAEDGAAMPVQRDEVEEEEEMPGT